MKKSIGIAVAMAGILILYGYIMSNAGHDHSAHDESSNQPKHSSASHEESHEGHTH